MCVCCLIYYSSSLTTDVCLVTHLLQFITYHNHQQMCVCCLIYYSSSLTTVIHRCVSVASLTTVHHLPQSSTDVCLLPHLLQFITYHSHPQMCVWGLTYYSTSLTTTINRCVSVASFTTVHHLLQSSTHVCLLPHLLQFITYHNHQQMCVCCLIYYSSSLTTDVCLLPHLLQFITYHSHPQMCVW